jgi:hypothetical protein
VTTRIPFLLGKGFIHDKGSIYFYGSTVAANARDEWQSLILQWSAGSWSCSLIETRLCGICAPAALGDVMVAVGLDGAFVVSKATGMHGDHVDPTPEGPSNLRQITALRAVGAEVFAVGMARMVYRLEPGSIRWRSIASGMVLPFGTGEVAGFKALDRDDRGRLAAVGFFGEIWLYENGRWRELDSPTNVKLEAVRWKEGELFIAGGSGTILYGEPDRLQVYDSTEIRDTIWSAEWFQDRLFLATGRGSVYSLGEGKLRKEELPGKGLISTGHLHAADGILLSVGAHDALIYDGAVWTVLDPPTGESTPPLDWTR